MINLKGKVALITAGSKGLGAEIVRLFAKLGAHVGFTYLHDAVAAEALMHEIHGMEIPAVAIQADAKDFSKASCVISEVQKKFGGLQILVCNAGIGRSKALWKMTEEDWDEVVDVSLKGAFNYIRAVAPIFKEQLYGKILCIGSINGLRGRIGSSSYNAAKAGLIGLVKTAAAELGQFNVNVNLVAPGFIETPSQTHTPELIRDLVLKECVIKRLGTPEDIAPIIGFLCSEAARHITGQIIKVDGGQYL